MITDAGHTDLATQLTLAAGRPLLLDLTRTRPAQPRPDRPQPHPDRPQPHPDAQAEAAAIRQAAAPWADRVDTVRAACPAHPDLRAVLIRPDGHTAWLSTADRTASDRTASTAPRRPHPADGLRQALTHWHGPASDAARERGA